jgi:hypothetical protein
MAKTLSLKKVRSQLLTNCKDWLDRFERLKIHLNVGVAATTAYQQNVGQTSSATGRQIDIHAESVQQNSDVDVLVLVHAGLVQEWSIFLDSVFSKGVFYLLKVGNGARLPRETLDLKQLDPANINKLRESIASTASENFSFRPYDKKIKIICDMFGIDDGPGNSASDSAKMRKHVEIRNMFQHNRGIVRNKDLERIGIKSFKILQDDQSNKDYVEGNKIILTLCEIQDLNKTINTFSKCFEVLK